MSEDTQLPPRLVVFDKFEQGRNFGELGDEEKDDFRTTREVVRKVVDFGSGLKLGQVPAKAFVSILTPSGRTASHYWSCLMPTAVVHKSYSLQLAVILSKAGVEFCCCLGAGAAGVQSPSDRELYDTAFRQLKEKLTTLSEGVKARITASFDHGWLLRKRWRLEPGPADYQDLSEWISFAAGPDGAGASISRYFSREDVPSTVGELQGQFRDAVELYGPLFDEIYPSSTSAGVGEAMNDDAIAWLDLMREYHRERIVLHSPVQGARYHVTNVLNTSCEVERLDAKESEVCTGSLYSQRLKELRSAGKLRISQLDATAARRIAFLCGPTVFLDVDRKHVLELTEDTDILRHFASAIEAMNVDRSGGVPKLYKPAMLYAAVQKMAITGENRIDFDEGLAGFMDVASRLGLDPGEQQAALAFFHLSREPFWLLGYHDLGTLVESSEVSPSVIRTRVSHAQLREPFFRLMVNKSLPDSVPRIIDQAWFNGRLHGAEPTSASVTPDGKRARRRYWALGAGEGGSRWPSFQEQGVAAIGWDFLGDLNNYLDRASIQTAIVAYRGNEPTPTNDSLACFEFAHEIRIGDYVVAKIGRGKVLGVGEVESDYYYDPNGEEYPNLRRVRWLRTARMQLPEPALVPTKTLTDVTDFEEFVAFVEENLLADAVPPAPTTPAVPEQYDVDDALRGLFMPPGVFKAILAAMRRKKNVILQGPPGVGKTFVAKRLAYALIGAKDASRVEMVQFHQSYSYEDFVQGWRPDGRGGFRLRPGVFYEFCRSASERGEPHVLIIDEINRGNLGRIFGELMMLIEAEYRGAGHAVPLTYAEDRFDRFYVPENLYVIGLMNTADRSLAMVDYALRRRFSFFTIPPGFDSDVFPESLREASVSAALCARIVERVGTVNEAIRSDRDLGPGFLIGHSFFCPPPGGVVNPEMWYSEIINAEIAPLLREYWFDDPTRADRHIEELLD